MQLALPLLLLMVVKPSLVLNLMTKPKVTKTTEEVVEEVASMPDIPLEMPNSFGTPSGNDMPLSREFGS